MPGLPTMLEFVVAVGAAFLGGALAKRFHQPPVLGYLLVGVLLGPWGLGLISDSARIQVLAQVGVAFLIFLAGTELSYSRLRQMRGMALLGPFLLLLLMAPFGVLAALRGPWSPLEVAYLGLVLYLSSTTLLVKVLTEREELKSPHGQTAVAFSIVQDLVMVPALVLLVPLSGLVPGTGPLRLAGGVALGLGKAALFVVVAYSLGTTVVPAVLRWLYPYGREVLLLFSVAVALGMAYATTALGLSPILGAFLAGLVVAESEESRRVLREMFPLRDLFATVFFLSVGMLLDLRFVVGHLPGVLAVLGMVMGGKGLLVFLTGLLFRYPARTALLLGLGLGQMGEEAFVVALSALSLGVLGPETYSLVLAGAVLSILLSPPLYQGAGLLQRGLGRVPLVGRAFQDGLPVPGEDDYARLRDHTVLCGYGQMGQEVAEALRARGIPFVVVEADPRLAGRLREEGVPCLVGDASQEAVLGRAGIDTAQVVAVTVSDPVVARSIVRAARRLRQGVIIIARGPGWEEGVNALKEAGATEVVSPAFEAGQQFTRLVLRGNGVPVREVERFLLTQRIGFYG